MIGFIMGRPNTFLEVGIAALVTVLKKCAARISGLLVLALLWLVCQGDVLAQTATGTISGTVVGSDGAPISAVVTANRIGLPPATGHADSAPNGSFYISGLADGTYSLCATDRRRQYLDPCAWSAQEPSVKISGAQAVTGLKLVLEKGSLLQVRLNDPTQVLESTAKGAASPKPHVITGVFTDRRTFQPLSTVGKDASGRDQQTVIPFDRPVSLHLVGRGVSVTGASGQPLDVEHGSSQSVTHLSGGSPQPLTFTVQPKP